MWCILGGIVWRNQFYLHLSIVKDLVHDPSKALSKRRCGITATWNRDAYDVVSAGPNLTWAIWIHSAKCRATLEAKFEMDLAVMPCKVPLLFLPLLRGTKKQRLETWETSRDLQYRLQTESPNKTRKNMPFFCGCSQCSPFRSVSPSVPWLFLSKFCPWKVAARSGSNSFDPFLTEVQGFMESETPSCTMLHHVAPCCTMLHQSTDLEPSQKQRKSQYVALKHWSIAIALVNQKGWHLFILHDCIIIVDCLPFPLGHCFDEAGLALECFGGFPLVYWFASAMGIASVTVVNRMGLGNTVRAKAGRSPMDKCCIPAWHAKYPSWDGLVWHVLYSCNTACAICASSRKSDLGFVCLCFSVASYPSPCRVLSQFLQDVIKFSKYWWNMSTFLSGSFRFFPARCLRSRTWRGMEPSLSRTLQRKKSSDFSFNLNSISVYARSSSL